jgi:hypothetical protein
MLYRTSSSLCNIIQRFYCILCLANLSYTITSASQSFCRHFYKIFVPTHLTLALPGAVRMYYWWSDFPFSISWQPIFSGKKKNLNTSSINVDKPKPFLTKLSHEEFYLLGYNAVWSVEIQSTFHTNMLPLFSGSKNKPSMKAGGKQSSHASVSRGLFFEPEYGGDMFLQNVGRLSTNYTALYPRRHNFT